MTCLAVESDLRHEITTRVLEHMIAAVRATPAEREPFPHFVVHGILPDDVYREVLESLPPAELYEGFTYDRPADKGGNKRKRFPRIRATLAMFKRRRPPLWHGDRGRLQLTNASLDRLAGRQQSLWLGIRDALGSPEFKAAVFEQLADGLRTRFGQVNDVAALAAYPVPELFRETSGYAIHPHPDTAQKVVTMQIALPADDTQSNLGTQFYRPSTHPAHADREPRGFEIAKQVPFLPNVAYAFVVLNNKSLKSWHGRTQLANRSGTRNTILHLWYADATEANPDLVERYYRQTMNDE
jgi:hypothetical protein